MGTISRGFTGRRSSTDARLPPGRYLTTDFPVSSAGPTPHVPLDRWEFVIDDGTNILRKWDWKSFHDLPTETVTVDLHCVTRWSKLGTSWEGVSLDRLLADVKTDASKAAEQWLIRKANDVLAKRLTVTAGRRIKMIRALLHVGLGLRRYQIKRISAQLGEPHSVLSIERDRAQVRCAGTGHR